MFPLLYSDWEFGLEVRDWFRQWKRKRSTLSCLKELKSSFSKTLNLLIALADMLSWLTDSCCTLQRPAVYISIMQTTAEMFSLSLPRINEDMRNKSFWEILPFPTLVNNTKNSLKTLAGTYVPISHRSWSCINRQKKRASSLIQLHPPAAIRRKGGGGRGGGGEGSVDLAFGCQCSWLWSQGGNRVAKELC